MRRYLVNRGVIALMVDYYMGPFSPYYYGDRGIKRVSIGSSDKMNFSEFVATFANAVCSCYNHAPQNEGVNTTFKLPPTAYTVCQILVSAEKFKS
jgi:hypothetical protein